MFAAFVICWCIAMLIYGASLLLFDGEVIMRLRPTPEMPLRFSECWFQDVDGRIYVDEEALLDGSIRKS